MEKRVHDPRHFFLSTNSSRIGRREESFCLIPRNPMLPVHSFLPEKGTIPESLHIIAIDQPLLRHRSRTAAKSNCQTSRAMTEICQMVDGAWILGFQIRFRGLSYSRTEKFCMNVFHPKSFM
jgi:hypothetical protein